MSASYSSQRYLVKTYEPCYLIICGDNYVPPQKEAIRWKSGVCVYGADSMFAPSQWETAVLCNDVSHRPGASLKTHSITFFLRLSFVICHIINASRKFVGWHTCDGNKYTSSDAFIRVGSVITLMTLRIELEVGKLNILTLHTPSAVSLGGHNSNSCIFAFCIVLYHHTNTFCKSIFKHQLGCRFDILDSISSFYCILTYPTIYVLIRHIIFGFIFTS